MRLRRQIFVNNLVFLDLKIVIVIVIVYIIDIWSINYCHRLRLRLSIYVKTAQVNLIK